MADQVKYLVDNLVYTYGFQWYLLNISFYLSLKVLRMSTSHFQQKRIMKIRAFLKKVTPKHVFIKKHCKIVEFFRFEVG